MLVREVMNKKPAILAPGATLADVLDLMAREKIRHVVVVDNDAVVGILSDRDLAMFYDPAGMTRERWQQTTAAQLMTPNPVSVGSSSDLSAAAKLLLKHAVSALPVVDNGQLAGILSEKDFVRHFGRPESK